MKKLIIIVVFLSLIMPLRAQHSSLTSNYLFNLFAVNPAYAGAKKALDVTAFYRKQWVGFSGSPQNFGLMGHLQVKPKNLSVGLRLESEKIGLFTKQIVSSAFSYKLKFNKKTSLSFALSPGFSLLQTDWNRAITTIGGDETFLNNNRQSNFSTGFGTFFTDDKIYIGVSSPDLMMINSSSKKLEYNLIGGYVFKVNKNLSLKPAFLARSMNAFPVSVDLSFSTYLYSVFGIGCSYRHKESAILFAEYAINKNFKAGYAYDYNIGGLQKFNSGSHEVMLNYFFGKTVTAPSPRFF
jgi:type IX secretion system PorP/SprF family membrane protein